MILNNESNKKKKFEQFFIMTYPKVKAFAWKLLKSEEDAEDIAQDIFAKLWTNPEIWENQETWNSYIYTMVRNHIYNFLKHKSIRQTYQEQYTKEEPAISETDIHDQLYAKESELLIKLTIANMPEQRRKIFRMSRTQEKSNQEIADELDISIRTVERHIYLALIDLKKVLLTLFFFYLG
ncbi:RNA polymerase sigma-70 factor [Bacteroides fragilis]|jgi:RNA polymerase sigma-70 factor (ECF subfamily)|uniref:RNA polymerase sigma-70 factor n=1 Tax=Bacteroides fragilis TaxID=817 RepID=UPI0022AA50FB|nr:RNA polymerase sigma-70 factor [Bacteroides fragilis]MCZ2585381.1 RNA polymerase sigma-70 factor [Bacteroides fragilis]